MAAKKYSCGRCSAKYDHQTKLGAHWDKYPKHMNEKQVRQRAWRRAAKDGNEPSLPTIPDPTRRARTSWKYCPHCGEALKQARA